VPDPLCALCSGTSFYAQNHCRCHHTGADPACTEEEICRSVSVFLSGVVKWKRYNWEKLIWKGFFRGD